MTKVIDEIREITAKEVAKKQDAAKLNYPKIIEKIKAAANRGFSQCLLEAHEMNEYNRKLLQQEGFSSQLIDKLNKNEYSGAFRFDLNITSKEWVIKW